MGNVHAQTVAESRQGKVQSTDPPATSSFSALHHRNIIYYTYVSMVVINIARSDIEKVAWGTQHQLRYRYDLIPVFILTDNLIGWN